MCRASTLLPKRLAEIIRQMVAECEQRITELGALL
jgi:hypothetical protein